MCCLLHLIDRFQVPWLVEWGLRVWDGILDIRLRSVESCLEVCCRGRVDDLACMLVLSCFKSILDMHTISHIIVILRLPNQRRLKP
jgi:hypothetical protein